MGIQNTQLARTELTRTATTEQINARTLTAQGISAQRGGTVVEALSYYYEATAFDPSLLEAANRVSVLSATIASGNIGENVRNDIQWRNEWLRILQEADNFYEQHNPFEIIYDPTIIQGNINYNNSTVQLSFRIAASPVHTAFMVIENLCQGLFNTGKSKEWGLDTWPFYNRYRSEMGNLPGLWGRMENNYLSEIRINTELKNQKDKTIGTASKVIEGTRPRGLDSRSGKLYMPIRKLETVTFYEVKADDITDNLSVSIVSVNGISAEDAVRRGYMRISTGILPREKNQ
jgi:hypothetical protein